MKIVILSPRVEKLKDVHGLLDSMLGTRETVPVKGDANEIPVVVQRDHPDVLIIEGMGGGAEVLAGVEHALQEAPALAVILVADSPGADLLLQAMRSGVREVLSGPLSEKSLREAVERLQRRGVVNNRGQQLGKVVAFIPCKGGSGATFLASNLAYALAAQENKRVALFDLNLQFGDAALFVSDTVPRTTLSDLVQDINRLDGAFLASSMVQVLPNFGVLPSPEELGQVAGIKPEHIDRLIEVATRHYDFVILDIGRRLDSVTIRALDRADVIFPVLQLTLPFLRDAKRLLNAFQSLGYDVDRIRLVANRHVKKGEIGLQSVEKTLGRPISVCIPNSFEAVAASVNQGVPIVKLAVNDVVAKGLTGLATELVHGRKERGWFSGMFRSA